MDNEELEWELHDIFESGLFAFPIYEHNGARRIVQYLLYRGVPDEEIAGETFFSSEITTSFRLRFSQHQRIFFCSKANLIQQRHISGG